MYSNLTLGKRDELELNFRVKIACAKHSKEFIINVCKNPGCAHNPLSCYKCLAESPEHLNQHHSEISPIHEYLSTLMFATVNGLIDKSDILNVNEMEFLKSTFQRTKDNIQKEKANCELFLNDFKYNICKEVDNLKYSILEFYDKFNENMRRSFENYVNCFEKGKGHDFLIKYGDLRKTLDKLNKVNSEKALKMLDDIKVQQEAVRKAKNHLGGYHSDLNRVFESFRCFRQMDDIDMNKLKFNVIKPIININEELCRYYRTKIKGIWSNQAETNMTEAKEEEQTKKPDIQVPISTPQNAPIRALKQPDAQKSGPEEYMKNTEIDLIYDL
jgi:hypothetical protein